ncbi:MAG TPA: hypothetical protein VN455_12400 [Methanotrichaceae archaeon]|nr:hypothetical protein [Methanotrichaceae archaeon]
MKVLAWFLMVMTVLMLLMPTGLGKGSEEYISVNDITMSLDKGDALFQLNYTLDILPRIYVLTLGCKFLEPDLTSLLNDYGKVRIMAAGPYRAALLVTGMGENNSGYYLFESRPLGFRVAKLTVVYPEGIPRTFYNVSATPNVFCEAESRAPWKTREFQELS